MGLPTGGRAPEPDKAVGDRRRPRHLRRDARHRVGLRGHRPSPRGAPATGVTDRAVAAWARLRGAFALRAPTVQRRPRRRPIDDAADVRPRAHGIDVEMTSAPSRVARTVTRAGELVP